jgi:hypothetical protein
MDTPKFNTDTDWTEIQRRLEGSVPRRVVDSDSGEPYTLDPIFGLPVETDASFRARLLDVFRISPDLLEPPTGSSMTRATAEEYNRHFMRMLGKED